ncbi:DUF2007 domain-containing protein [Candidatus Omnitrophota bacterium]
MQEKKGFSLVYSTPNSAQVAIIKSILIGTDIPFFVTNENFHNLYGSANGLTAMGIMVASERLEEAKELLGSFIDPKAK